MSLLALERVAVEGGGRVILDVEHLKVQPGELLAVVGPTGAGKSTLLRVAHLLERPARGRVQWQGEPVVWPAPLETRRRIAMAFQDPLLFTGTVAENVGYGLEVRGANRAAVRARVVELLELLGVGHLAARRAATLSGGEARRASLARALAAGPELLLLDEPLASLDAPVRERLRGDLVAIVRGQRLTCVWVTHDQEEAFAVADRIVVLEAGRVAQSGTPEDVFFRPATPFVAGFVGAGNVLPGRVEGSDDGLVTVDLGGLRLEAVSKLQEGASVVVCIRPEEITLGRDGGPEHHSARNRMNGTVVAVVTRGATTRVEVECGVRLQALVTRRSAAELGLETGVPVWLSVKATAVHLIPGQEEAC
ncbi:MAG TPA: ABC transporter ATP-binding protein [Thermoanaerobaculaceae bacterium]|nr:ABC transporter ATP-binding protein [Thermoanaerobaculaceae bacterium]